MKDLPISLETFSTLRENDYLYIDKTEHIYKLAKPGKRYFLSRPRRFGKSLLLNTIEELYKGNKELFKDLYIYDKWDWSKTQPIIKLNFGKRSYGDSNELKTSLNKFLEETAINFNIELMDCDLLADKFGELIEKIHKKFEKELVILIDEYDQPIIKNMAYPEKLEDIQSVLHDFYSVFKASDEHIELLFVTGVSKFSGTSLFSGFNNPDDLTLDYNYNLICGISQDELERDFSEYIEETAKFLRLSKNNLLEELKNWYNGYSWDGKETVYNPNSLLKFFKKKNLITTGLQQELPHF